IIRELEARGGYEQRALIVAYTANAIPGERERCLKAGMDDFLAKPVTPSQLARVIVEAARNRNALKTARALESAEGKPVLDPARMEQLCVEIDREVVMEMVRMFLDQFPGQCDACRGNLENARFAELIRNAHLIRGTAASLGAAALEQSAASLENAAALRNRTRLFREFERLMAAGEETCKALEAWLAESVIS
ncbi:MAG: Hpt domain-containing protein, partial [Verrucomicrobiota bacterium]